MTEQQAKSSVVTTANGQVGYREGENNYNKFAAELDKLNVFFGKKQNQPWCGVFVLWVFYKCFGIVKALAALCSPNPSGIPLCSTAAGYFKAAGRWSTSPSVGAVVFFYVNGAINHTGIVTAVSGKTITTVEGNSSDMVSRRTYSVGSAQIAGYGIPIWSVVAKNATVEPSEEIPVSNSETPANLSGLPTLSKGNRSEAVRAAQLLLVGRGYTCGSYGADADFGNATYTAVCNFQRAHNLAVDGIIGAQTWAALLGVSA